MRTHKVGTVTLGCTLILFGVLFLVHLFGGLLTYSFIFRLWPVVFLLLGGEVLLSTLPKTGQKFSFDGASIVLLVIMLLFAMCMAGADTFFQALDHYEWIRF